MTVNFFEDDESDDFFTCPFLESDLFEDDERDDGFEFNESIDDLTVDFAFDSDNVELACIYTGGLWQLGIPELYLRPPRDSMCGDAMADARLAVFLAAGMVHLGNSLLETDGFDVPPYRVDLDGREIQFWLGDHQAPFERLARYLDPDVDTVIEVHCSLWHAPLLGNGWPR